MVVLLSGVYLIAMAVMILEVTLTRLFSVILYYHYVFMVVSFTILGLGVGAAYVYRLRPGLWSPRKFFCNLTIYSWLFALSILLSTIWIQRFPFVKILPVYSLVAFAPFFFAGAILAVCFGRFPAFSGRIYFADLSGAASGALVVILLIGQIGAGNSALLLTVVICGAGLLFSLGIGKSYRILSSVGVCLALILFFCSLKYPFLQLSFPSNYHYTKTLFATISNPEENAKIVYTDWSALGRTDVVEGRDPSVKVVYTDGGAGTPMLGFNGDLEKIDYLKEDIGFFPYLWGRKDEVLIIGPGGGKDVLFALLGDSDRIVGVEINPGIIRAMRRFAESNGGIYENFDNVKIIVDEGRRFVRSSREKYDILYLSLVYTQSAELKGCSLTENYVYTREAFGEYLNHLKKDGRLVMIFHDIHDLTKGFITALAALRGKGKNIQEAAKHTIVINGSDDNVISRPLLVVRESKFSPQEVAQISRLALESKFTPLFLPYWEKGVFYSLVSKGEENLQSFISYTSARMSPATDNSPFFYQFDKGVPPELKVLLYPVGFVLAALILWIVLRGKKKARGEGRLDVFLPVYFPLLGIGYMLIEVSLIQKFLLFLGYPSLLLSVVLFSLLLSSGLGSLLSDYLFSGGASKKIFLVPLIISVLMVSYIPALGFIFDKFLTKTILFRSLVVMTVVFPLGFLMGIPFPVGLRMLKERFPEDVPLAYAINGVASVMGSILVVVIALLLGLIQAFVMSALVYLVVTMQLLGAVPVSHKNSRSFLKGNIDTT